MKNTTRQAIIDSYLKLLSKKQLKYITVKDIVEDIDMNRKTFYYYFTDIYDLTEKVFFEYIEKFSNEFSTHDDSFKRTILELTIFLKKNQKTTMHIYKSIGLEKMEDIFLNAFSKYFREMINERARGKDVNQKYIDIISNSLSVSLSAIVTRWIHEGMKENPDDLIKSIVAIVHGMIDLTIKNASDLSN